MRPPRHKPLSELTADELRGRAEEMREMAQTASSQEVRQALLRLAERFDRLADDRN